MRIDVRDAHHGPLVVEVAVTRVVAKTDRKRIGPEETLIVTRAAEETAHFVVGDRSKGLRDRRRLIVVMKLADVMLGVKINADPPDQINLLL